LQERGAGLRFADVQVNAWPATAWQPVFPVGLIRP
jgi:hypothetical protein